MIEYESLGKSNAHFLDALKIAASRVIESGWYILGSEVEQFESEFASFLGAKHCIGVANGLDALILSIEALNLPPKSEILVASNTYIATILAIIRAGHYPVLVEPVIETFNIDPKLLRSTLTSKTRAVLVTHLFGKSCQMDEVVSFVKEHGLFLIEDCAQSHGAKFKNEVTGLFGDAGCFSFYPTKNLGAIGDAGAVVTNNDGLAEKLRALRNYGSKQKYINEYVGSNSRLDEIQAAMLRVKLSFLDQITDHKRNLAKIYLEGLPDWVIKPVVRPDEYDVFHIFGIRHPNRDLLRNWLLESGVKTEIHYPITPHQQNAMKKYLNGNFSIATKLHETELSLPISYGTTAAEVRRVCEIFADAPLDLRQPSDAP
jgi:dTDP-4-amino-4,6-dideoxygalactose transaminase